MHADAKNGLLLNSRGACSSRLLTKNLSWSSPFHLQRQELLHRSKQNTSSGLSLQDSRRRQGLMAEISHILDTG
jgi:hypothetical protein